VHKRGRKITTFINFAHILSALAIDKSIDPSLPLDDDLVDIFYKDGQPLQKGDMLKRPGIATVLDDLAEHGVDLFYTGKYAEEIVNAVRGHWLELML
jgi:gamma-glutamyltranspeptidase